MTRTLRKRIFYALVALFVVGGAFVVLYAEGWRVDPATMKVSKVGAIYVRSFPGDAAITLSGKSVRNRAGFLNPGTLVSDLFPGAYSLSLSAPGFRTWSERADVLPSLVATFKYAVLVPENATAAPTSSVRTRMIASGGTITDETQSFAVLRLPGGGYRAYDLSNGTTTDASLAVDRGGGSSAAITRVALDPEDGMLYAETQLHVWAVNLRAGTSSLLASAPDGTTLTPALAASPSMLAWGTVDDATGRASAMIYDIGTGRLLDPIPLPHGARKLLWLRGGALGILDANGTLSRYESSGKTSEALATDALDLLPSDDGTLLAVVERRGVEVLSLASNDRSLFMVPNADTLERLAWYKDKNHLFLEYPGRIAFLDLADKDLRNVETVADGTGASYDPGSNALFLRNSAGRIVRYQFPQ